MNDTTTKNIEKLPQSISPMLLIVSFVLVGVWLSYSAFIEKNTDGNFSIKSLISTKHADQVTAFTHMDLQLSPQVTDAINHSVPIYINVEYAFIKEKAFQKKFIQKKLQQYRLEKHSLSDKFVLSDISANKQQNFDSISAALNYLGQPYKMSLNLTTNNNQIAVRTYINLKELPSALRLKKLFSKAWLHDTGWSIWPLST